MPTTTARVTIDRHDLATAYALWCNPDEVATLAEAQRRRESHRDPFEPARPQGVRVQGGELLVFAVVNGQRELWRIIHVTDEKTMSLEPLTPSAQGRRLIWAEASGHDWTTFDELSTRPFNVL